MAIIKDGEFFSVKSEEYNDKTRQCVETAVNKLEEIGDKPLMMLGRIQSGKTRSFIGVISLAFDNGYDLAIVLTKGTNALAKQTTARMNYEFRYFKEEEVVDVYDIMSMPPTMSKFELDKKLIIVVKKEKNNLPKMIDFIKKHGIDKKCLIIDDEADFCSIGYEKDKDTADFDLRKIAKQINQLRLSITCKFIQVTATPYSLYLQPDHMDYLAGKKITPIKPADTVLVPCGDGYIGGNYYFNSEYSELLYQEIDPDELSVLRKSDRRVFKEEDALTSNKIKGLRDAVMNFIVGGCIRMLQNGGKPGRKENKFSFIIHTDIGKSAHQRQDNIISAIIELLEAEAEQDSDLLNNLIEQSYDALKISIEAYGFKLPTLEEVKTYVKEAITGGWIIKEIVNSEKDIDTLLDESGQLKLRGPLNIFIGGQILDRGITISKLIGFYYGRNPKTMQQDTVLQHARMYGYRSEEDLAVTRLYTTMDLYYRMKKINEIDEQLRKDFEAGKFDSGVVFIGKDPTGKVIPCSPDKIKLSNAMMLKPGSTLLPVGFQSGYRTNIQTKVAKIDTILRECNSGILEGEYIINVEKACMLIDMIYDTYDTKEIIINDVDAETMKNMIKFLANDTNEVCIYCRTGRDISRERSSKTKGNTNRIFSDMPYSRDGDLQPAKKLATTRPVLMLMKQNGASDKGWRDAEFYWPVIVTQENVMPYVYTSDLIK